MEYLFLQVHTHDLPVLMEQEVSIRMTRLLRHPANGILSDVIRDHYWPKIAFFSNPEDELTADPTWTPPRHRELTDGTLLDTTIDMASRAGNDDLESLMEDPITYVELPKESSSYRDLSDDRYAFRIVETPFTDEFQLFNENALLLFTDGACGDWNEDCKMLDGRFGGFGSYRITYSGYQHLLQERDVARLRPGRFYLTDNIYLPDKYSLQLINHLSSRCSIDFCEAHAIREGLESLVLDLRVIADAHQHGSSSIVSDTYRRNTLPPSDNITSIYIISDSLVVLEWIRGRYRIRNPRMQGLIDDILHSMSVLSTENHLNIYTCWVKSHRGTMGNERADGLASQGLIDILQLKDEDKAPQDRWRWYNLRAACNYNKTYTRHRQELLLRRLLSTSRFACHMRSEMERNLRRVPALLRDADRIGYRWSKRWLHECKDLNRGDVRVLLMIRTGHDRLGYYNYHALHRGDSDRCFCGHGPHTVQHLLRDCRDPRILRLQHYLHRTARTIFSYNIGRRAVDSLQRDVTDDYYSDHRCIIHRMPSNQYFMKVRCYLYPDGRLPRAARARLQRLICHFYKQIRSIR